MWNTLFNIITDSVNKYWSFWNHHLLEGKRKEGHVLFNDALNTFYLRLYGVGHMVKDHSDSESKPAAAIWATFSD